MIEELNEDNFQENISSGLKVIVFSATWCKFCQKQDEVFEQLPDIKVGKVDGDKNPSLVNKYDVVGFPTFVIFKNGKEVSHFSGYKNKYELMNILTKYI